MERRQFLKSVAGVTGLAALNLPLDECHSAPNRPSPYNLYWGDMHCHCRISYAKGTIEDALEAGQENGLDFCCVVGHSSWHDTPRDEEHMNRIKKYIVDHDEGYERLANVWPKVKKLTREVTKPGKFIAFLGFEWHSIKYGDNNVYYFEPEGEIIKADSIAELRAKVSKHKAIIVPHHIAYNPESRGITWDHFVASEQSPFVEAYSFHGCCVSDTSPYPMLREMGARDHERTMETGLKRGFKFGISGSTDNHYGYPGSFGEGKIAAYADELTRTSLWEAFKSRRVYAVSGDRIKVDYRLNNAFMGQETSAGPREINLNIVAEDFIDYVDIIKNGNVIKRFCPLFSPAKPTSLTVRAKIRFEWGWGTKDRLTEWDGTLKLSDGRFRQITPCFRAQYTEGGAYKLWQEAEKEYVTFISRITESNDNSVSFHSYSFGNPTPLTPINNSLLLDVEMPLNATIQASVNGREFKHTLAELLEGQRSHLIGGYLDVLVSFHRAAPESAFTLKESFLDAKPQNPTDYYYLCVRQRNNQWAWSSPIWVKS